MMVPRRLRPALKRLPAALNRLLAVLMMIPGWLWPVVMKVMLRMPQWRVTMKMKATLKTPLWLILYAPPREAVLLMRRRRFLLTR